MPTASDIHHYFSNVISSSDYAALDAIQISCSVQMRLVDTEGNRLEKSPIIDSLVGELPSLMDAVLLMQRQPEFKLLLKWRHDRDLSQDIRQIDVKVHNGKKYMTTSYFITNQGTDYSAVDIWKDKRMLLQPNDIRESLGWPISQIDFVMEQENNDDIVTETIVNTIEEPEERKFDKDKLKAKRSTI